MEELLQEKSYLSKPITGLRNKCKLTLGLTNKTVNFF